jgi:exodeoxyribonuclease VII small subunit
VLAPSQQRLKPGCLPSVRREARRHAAPAEFVCSRPSVRFGEHHAEKFTKLKNFSLDISHLKRHYNSYRSNPILVKFEDCLERLEKIVQELEKGEVPLEKSLTLFEEGMQLSATCRKQLEDAEGKVEILLKQNGKLQTEPFEPPAEKALRK